MEDEDETSNEDKGNQDYDEINQNMLEDILHKQPKIEDNNDVTDNYSEDENIAKNDEENPDKSCEKMLPMRKHPNWKNIKATNTNEFVSLSFVDTGTRKSRVFR